MPAAAGGQKKAATLATQAACGCAAPPEPVGVVPARLGAQPAATADTGSVRGCCCSCASCCACCCCCPVAGRCWACSTALAAHEGTPGRSWAARAAAPAPGTSPPCWAAQEGACAGARCPSSPNWPCHEAWTSPVASGCQGPGCPPITRWVMGLHAQAARARQQAGVHAYHGHSGVPGWPSQPADRLACWNQARANKSPLPMSSQGPAQRRARFTHPRLKMFMPPCSSLRMACSWYMVDCTSWCSCGTSKTRERGDELRGATHGRIAARPVSRPQRPSSAVCLAGLPVSCRSGTECSPASQFTLEISVSSANLKNWRRAR